MTPAKMWALKEAQMDTLELAALPVDKLACMYANMNRDPGEKDSNGHVVRHPAPVMPFEDFRTFRRKGRTLAAKEVDSWDASLFGAKADRGAFEAWAGVGTKATFEPTGRN